MFGGSCRRIDGRLFPARGVGPARRWGKTGRDGGENLENSFATFQSFAGQRLDATAGQSGSEVTGNCRLKWYDRMMRNPLKAAVEAEQFTRELHQALSGDQKGLDRALAIARDRLDAGRREVRSFPTVATPEQALETLKKAVVDAHTAYAAAIAPLAESEIAELRQGLYPTLAGQCFMGHALGYPGSGRRLCDLLEKMDRCALFQAADALAPLSDPQFLKQLAKLPDKGKFALSGVTGTIVREIATPAGKIVIAGRGDNVYELDEMADVCAVVDLGGADVYHEGTVSAEHPVRVLIDLAGDDRYEGRKPGIQGAAVLGVSMLIDVAGEDVYDAQDVAQGSAMGGVGILIDYGGHDSYGCGAQDNSYTQRGGAGGFLIDRPLQDEVDTKSASEATATK
jgi:hypothetical protein